jgi:hypothetical protein
MFARLTSRGKLQNGFPLLQWPTMRAPAATMARRMVTGSASGRTAAAGGEAEAVDPFSTAAVRIRKEVLGVRNISKLQTAPAMRFSN